MSGFQPLVVLAGLIQNVGDRRSEILRLNLGPPERLTVVGDFTISRTIVFVVSPFNPIVRNILGGEEGDLLILGGNNVRLRGGGGNLQLDGGYDLVTGRVIIFYQTPAGQWFEIYRK